MDQDHKHQCKFCSKIFPSGRSLGGHMRSHLEDKGKLKESGGYVLRENPKKNLRLFGSTASLSDEKKKPCEECGKEFQSWKALFGHMRCHSKKVARKVEEKKDEGSLSNGSLIKGSIGLKVPRKKKRSRRAFSASSSYTSSSSMFEYSKEQEDVAISLMMLSRDVGYLGFNFCHVGESSDKNSAVLEDRRDRDCDDLGSLKSQKLDSGYVSDCEHFELGKVKIEMDASDSKLASIGTYGWTTGNQSFDTPRPLGGHRASRKRMKGFHAPTDQVEGNEEVGVIKGNHQCLICGKVFRSGQALGGHKRCHFAMASPSAVIQQEEDLIDLNLPAAPIEESISVEMDVDAYNSWWVGSNLEGKEVTGMIAN